MTISTPIDKSEKASYDWSATVRGCTVTDEKIRTSLEMSRALFDGRGDDFLDAFAAWVERGGIVISEASAQRLLDTVRSAALLTTEVLT